jgi:hypothetical protein
LSKRQKEVKLQAVSGRWASAHFLFVASALEGILETTLAGLGFELVDAQVSNPGGTGV